MKVTKEVAFEDAIVESLCDAGGYTRGIPTNYDPAIALDSAELFAFIGATQADEWEGLVQRNGADSDVAQRRFTERLAKQIDERGTIDVLLERRLPSEPSGSMDLGDQIAMTHLRVKRTGEHDLSLEKGAGVLHAFGEGGPGGYDELLAPLSQLIDKLNDLFGANLSEADRLHLEGIGADMAADPQVQQQAAANTAENFGIEFDKRFTDAVAARMSQAEELTIRIRDKPEFRAEVIGALMPRVCERARVAYQETCPIGELLARKEDKHLELKSSLRWDLEEGERSRLVEGATIKTVAAFLNAEFGGTLVIGVADDGTIVGLEHDYGTLHKAGKDDADLFLLHLNQLISNSVGLAAAANITTTVHRVDGHDVCRVHVEPSGHPVDAEVTVVDEKGQFSKEERFYVRLNNGTRAIDDERERERYIAQRWGRQQRLGESDPLDRIQA